VVVVATGQALTDENPVLGLTASPDILTLRFYQQL
jgi:hypothetical protein